MGKATAFAILLAAGLATPALGQSFLGGWVATAHLEGGSESLEKLSVVKTGTGYAVTGKPVDPPPDGVVVGPIVDVVLDGDKFSYRRSLDVGGNKIDITYAGTVSGNTFTGMAELGGTAIPYTGMRIPADQ